jgi:hypothetical protein
MLRPFPSATSGSDNGTPIKVGQMLDIAARHTGIRLQRRLNLPLLLPKVITAAP